MFYITAHDKLQPAYVDDEISGGGRSIPKNATASEFEYIGETLNLIDCWIKLIHNNDEVRSKIYNEAIYIYI